MRSKFGRRARAAFVLYMCGSVVSAWAVDPSQLPRDDSTGPGSAVGNTKAPWINDVETVRQQIPVSIANARTETATWNCGTGYAGVRFQTRLVKTFTNGVVQADPWSDVQGQCIALPAASGIVSGVIQGTESNEGAAYGCTQGSYTEAPLLVKYADGRVVCLRMGYYSPNGNN